MNAFEVILVLTIFLIVKRGAILRSKNPIASRVSTFIVCLAVTITTYTVKMAITASRLKGTKLVLLIYKRPEKKEYHISKETKVDLACSHILSCRCLELRLAYSILVILSTSEVPGARVPDVGDTSYFR